MTTQHKITKAKLNLLELGAYLGNVSEACRTLGYSRDTFYRIKHQYDEGGIEALIEVSRRKPLVRALKWQMDDGDTVRWMRRQNI